MIEVKSENPAMAREVLKECNINCYDLLEELNTRIKWAKGTRDSYETKREAAETSDQKQNLREDVIYNEAQLSILRHLRHDVMNKAINAIVFG